MGPGPVGGVGARQPGGAAPALPARVRRRGERDVRLLRRYADRGLRVEGLRTQVLAWSVVARRPDRLVLRVTDRLVGGVAVRSDGSTRARLPADRPTERRLTLVRREGRWLMARVT